MSTHNAQLPDLHGSSPISYTPQESSSNDTSNPDAQSPAALETISQLRAQNTQLQEKNIELRIQNAQLQAEAESTEIRIQNAQLQSEAENHVAISEMQDRFAQQLKQEQPEYGWYFCIVCALIFWFCR
ncbi:hypothetical protein BTUL_0002g00350 [Botrytis tulipae]|uniref:Uncharacterized protein n=1 Tax=Botrytis tulipae TaxID=87230 RepID=A0A4Z1FAA0_9HELO|nr:hypothetical protein BTUL_0002g00350 [Botrytis tulipae]